MPYTLKEIKWMREKIVDGDYTPDVEATCDEWYGFLKSLPGNVTIWADRNSWNEEAEDTYQFFAAAPSIIDQLLQEREELKEKIEGMRAITVKLSGEFELTPQEIVKNIYNQALSDVLALFKD